MDIISTYFSQYGLNLNTFLLSLGIITGGSILFGGLSRFIFGKHSTMVSALSSAIGIIFVYALNIVLHSAGGEFHKYTTPLPFITVTEDSMELFRFQGTIYSVICSEIVSLILLAFIMNLIDEIMPHKKNIFSWVLFRVLTVIFAQAAHLLIYWIATNYLTDGILQYAPMILLGLLILLLLTGALKLLVGLFLTTVHPVIAGLYTFFFASMIGKMITKAILTTAILSLLVYSLGAIGVVSICIALGALAAYIPLLVVLIALWYWIPKLFH